MKRAKALVIHCRPDSKSDLNRTARFFIDGTEIEGVISYEINDAVGTTAQRMTLEFYADVTIEQVADYAESSASRL